MISVAALLALVTIAARLPRWHGATLPAVVEAARTLELASIAPGSYRWTLRDGRTPIGAGLISERLLVFERSELVELELRRDLTTGSDVIAGEVLGSVRSLLAGRRLSEFEARRAALEARRQLIMAGGRAEEVSEARQLVELARAEWQAARANLKRVRELAEYGLVSAAELEQIELEDQVFERGVDVALSAVEVARAPARPEAVSEIDAELDEVEACIAEIRARRAEEVVLATIAGVLEIGGNGTELRVYDVDRVYISFPVPQSQRRSAAVGARVCFESASVKERFAGEVVAVAESASVIAGRSVFWVSASLPNPGHDLKPGVAGRAWFEGKGDAPSLLAALLRHVEGLS